LFLFLFICLTNPIPTESGNIMKFKDAQEDFHEARRKAALQAILARITGKSRTLLSYDEVRARLGGMESSVKELQDIPLDAIIGTVSRYSDFSRSLLPLNESDSERWARVRVAAENMIGLPPIDVYQIGEAYFILDGHHRASVARELGATHIQAYVRKVRTRVPLSPTDQIEDVIIKSEYTDFLSKTHLDDLRPSADLRVTVPGQYDKLLEHISVHRYFQGIDEGRPIGYEEAVTHWYDQVYSPIARVIHQRNILKDFPDRSEADLYIWVMEHRTTLEDELGWKVTPDTAIIDLASRLSPRIKQEFTRFIQRTVNAITPDEIEPSTPPGEWRRARIEEPDENHGLFRNILVAVPGDETGWKAVDLAVNIAANEGALLGGLYIQPEDESAASDRTEGYQERFARVCAERNVEGSLVVEQGNVTRVLFDRSFWADLLVVRLLHPPPYQLIPRLRSGLRSLIRLSPVPLLVVPPEAPTNIHCAMLAYGGGPRADEALYVATYLATHWKIDLTVITVDRDRAGDDVLAEKAHSYLTQHGVEDAQFIHAKGDPAKILQQNAENQDCDLILMGGYESGLMREIIFGSTVDHVLSSTRRSVLICR
jgi:nucleotide-binding universal stress UspA family protein